MEGEPPLRIIREVGEELKPTIEMQPLLDELVERHGFGPRSPYVETCWLPVLGPTATWLYRRLGSWAELSPEGIELDLVDLAVGLGLGEGLGQHSKLAKGLERLVRFDAARWRGDVLAVRRALAPVPERLAHSFSYSAYGFHRQMLDRPR